MIFKAIASRQAVPAGESFSVQYVSEETGAPDGFEAPPFEGFRIVSGPYQYDGSVMEANGVRKLKNVVYTLMALRPGRYVIPPATIRIKNRLIPSNSLVIDVTEKQDSQRSGAGESSEYFLQPGEDPYEKIRRNLFIRVLVNKRKCYVGEPVIATFKLYSRLESRSDIVKNPGFYGFTVQDMVGLGDNMTASETVEGKLFDVHIVRVVQLYPLQAGLFTIDPMEVINKVEFSRSAVNKKTEQEIVEGVLHKDRGTDARSDNTVTYENSIRTETVPIRVQALPEKNKPPGFHGATGRFSISASAIMPGLSKNAVSGLLVTILGRGNFTQLGAPAVHWPAGIEGFEPLVKDSLDRSHSPLSGSRTFRFPFVSSRPGTYTVPAISFSYFDPDSNRYRTVLSNPVIITINDAVKGDHEKAGIAAAKKNKRFPWSGWAAVLLCAIAGFAFWYARKRKTAMHEQEPALILEITPSVEQVLQAARFSLVADDGRFYELLQKGIWEYLGERLHLSGSSMSKQELRLTLRQKGVAENTISELTGLLSHCEAALFTRAELTDNKPALLEKAKVALTHLNR